MADGLKWSGFGIAVELVFFSSSWGSWSEFFDAFWRVFSLSGARWVVLSGWGLPLFFLRGSSDSRLVSLVRDFFGKILTGGIVDYCTVFLLLYCRLLYILVF